MTIGRLLFKPESNLNKMYNPESLPHPTTNGELDEANLYSCTPRSPLGKAISYAFGMWPRISRYCKVGYFNIDNYRVENSIRPITLGRKNYLFSGNDSGAEDNCIFYTLLGSCLEVGIEPHKWLSSTLGNLSKLKAPINS